MKLLEDIDELLAYLEDTAHGEEGKRITEMRHRIQAELSNSHKPVVMQAEGSEGAAVGNSAAGKGVSDGFKKCIYGYPIKCKCKDVCTYMMMTCA